jgi:TonB-dependent starch-binding outer membrane protein SusC
LGTTQNGMGIVNYGFSLPDFPNPDVIWERTSSQNIAIDAVLFKNLDLTFEYYNKLTDGILQTTRLPASVGSWNPPVVNIGKVRNSGFELSFSYRGTLGELGYMFGANLTTNKNEVVKLFGGSPLGGQYDRIEEGMPIRYLWGLELGGILQDEEKVAAYKNQVTDGGYSIIRPGDMWFVDQNGDSILNEKDYVYLGKTLPGFFYGFNLNLTYKGFDFSTTFTGVGDVQAYNGARAGLEGTGADGINLMTSVLDSWTPTNHSTTMPRAVYADPAGNGRFSSRYVESAAYLRWANIELGYSIPKPVFDKLQFASGLRVYVSGSNLLLLTKWSGLDPENDGYPIPRVWRVGLKATF